MTGLGLGAGTVAGLALGAGVPLSAVAAPATNHVPAWAPFPKALGATMANLAYANVDASDFHTYTYTPGRYLDSVSGVGHEAPGPNAWLAAPLSLPVGALVYQVNFAYQGTPTMEISKRIFTDPTDWYNELSVALPSGGGGPATHTVNLSTPVTIDHAASYSAQMLANDPGDSLYGMTLGYLPPAAGFVPFSGSTPRVFDSRGGARLGFQEEFTVNLGNPGARGALFNLTVTDTANGGFVAAFAADQAYPGNSSVNYTSTGQTVANGVVSALAPDGSITLRGGGPLGSCHVIVDRLGWFV
jgi:hypothetical protein